MCGIFGSIIGKKNSTKAVAFIKDAFLTSQVRGSDSSGLVVADTITNGKLASLHKLPVCGTMFITDKAAGEVIKESGDQYSITIGHVRAATSGKVGISNAHPFSIESSRGKKDREVVGVHNGTLSNWLAHKEAKYYDVDSEWALAQIYEEGLDAFRTIKGAYVFAWWDSSDREALHFALNDQRTMFIAFTEEGDMLYASEGGMLYWLMERNNIKLKGNILQLEPDHHYRFECDDVENFTKEELPKATIVQTNTSHETGYSRYYPTSNMMDNVNKVLGKYLTGTGTQLSLVSDKPAPPVATVTLMEVNTAKDYGMHNVKATFTPTMYIDGGYGVLGTVKMWDGSELEGRIRNAHSLRFGNGEVWDVSIIGVLDDGVSITAICSKPRVTVPQLQTATG